MATLLGCDVPAPTAPALRPGLVLFSVLDPANAQQVVLLMRSRASKPDTTTLTVVQEDPIVSSGETPVTGARVVLYSATGDSAVAVEDRVLRSDHLGAGVYRFWTAGGVASAPRGAFLSVIAGGRYRLRVTAPSLGAAGSAEGTTHVPSVTRVIAAPTRNVNLARDTVLMNVDAPQAGGYVYQLRAVSTNVTEGDAQYRRAIERRLILPPPSDEWAFAYALDRLRFNTRHVLTVAAADSNYFAYYGAQLDPFTDRTQGTTLVGAAGVFGSVLTIYTATIAIIGP